MKTKTAALAEIAVAGFDDEYTKLKTAKTDPFPLKERPMGVKTYTKPAPAKVTYKDQPTAPGKKKGLLGAPPVPTPGTSTAQK